MNTKFKNFMLRPADLGVFGAGLKDGETRTIYEEPKQDAVDAMVMPMQQKRQLLIT